MKRVNENHKEYTGTESYHRFSPLFKNVLATDGAMFIAEKYEAFWLLDAISSHLHRPEEPLMVVILLDHKPSRSKPDQFVLSIQDDIPMNTQYARQVIEFSDFPHGGVQFYAQYDGEYWVIYLPSEH